MIVKELTLTSKEVLAKVDKDKLQEILHITICNSDDIQVSIFTLSYALVSTVIQFSGSTEAAKMTIDSLSKMMNEIIDTYSDVNGKVRN